MRIPAELVSVEESFVTTRTKGHVIRFYTVLGSPEELLAV
jgi:hypothetical protein